MSCYDVFSRPSLRVCWCSQGQIYLHVGLVYEKKSIYRKTDPMFICDIVSATEQLVGFS